MIERGAHTDYWAHIRRALDYIEENPGGEPDNAAPARTGGLEPECYVEESRAFSE